MYGGAQTGKTGMVGLYLNKLPLYPDEELVGSGPHDDGYGEDDKGYGSESDNQDPCTEIRMEEVENKEEVKEYRFRVRGGDPKYVWKVYEIDTQYLMLADKIIDRIANPPVDPMTIFTMYPPPRLRTKFPPPPPPPKLNLPETSTENVIEVSAKAVLDLLPLKEDNEGTEKIHWIYVVECGGETMFLDIAPMLMRFYGINIPIHKATNHLDHEVQFTYCVDGKAVIGRGYRRMTTLENVKLMFSGKIEVKHPSAIGVVSTDFQRNLYYALAASYYDVYHALQKDDNVSQTLNERNDVYHKTLKQFCHARVDMHGMGSGQISFPFNTSTRQKKDLKTVERFKRLANHCFMEVQFPIRWYLFFVQINEIKASSRVMISLQECIQMASLVGIHSVDVVKAALEYFHDLMLVFYYPEISPQVVFLSPKRIFDKLSEVMAVNLGIHTATFDPQHVARLRKGILHRGLLNSISHGFVPNLFSPQDFLRLLNHLYIITPISDSEYVVPFLFPDLNEPHEQFVNDRLEPLLFSWKTATVPVPTGLLLTLVHYLLRLQSPQFTLTEEVIATNCRNKIALYCPAIEGNVVLFESTKFMGITHTGDLNHCLFVRETVTEAIGVVCDIMKWRKELKIFKEGFVCRLSEKCRAEPIVHMARANRNHFDFFSCKGECRHPYRDFLNPYTQTPWFRPFGKECLLMLYNTHYNLKIHVCQNLYCSNATHIFQ